MTREEILRKKIDSYLRKEQLGKSNEHVKLETSFMVKSRKNFTVANLLFRISEEDDLKKTLSIAHGFEMYDWTIIVSYYAMYTSALAAISRHGFKSKSHAATISVLELYYVHENRKLDDKHIHQLSKAHALSEELITKLMQIKTSRETAQYDATSAISRENAVNALENGVCLIFT